MIVDDYNICLDFRYFSSTFQSLNQVLHSFSLVYSYFFLTSQALTVFFFFLLFSFFFNPVAPVLMTCEYSFQNLPRCSESTVVEYFFFLDLSLLPSVILINIGYDFVDFLIVELGNIGSESLNCDISSCVSFSPFT